MPGEDEDFPDDPTAPERRKGLTEEQLKDLKLAGGVAGGMPAGSSGAPGQDELDESTKDEEDI